MNKTIFLLVLCCFFNFCCSQKYESINFIPLPAFSSDDTLKLDSNRIFYTSSEYFLVEHYSGNDTGLLRQAINNLLIQGNYEHYNIKNGLTISFFKISKKTNLETVNQNKKIFDYFPNDDLLCEVYIYNGDIQEQDIEISFFKNSQLLNMPEDIIIKDVLPNNNH